MLPSFGFSLLLIAILVAAYSIPATALAFRPGARRTALLASAHNATIALFLSVTGAAFVLWALFLTDEFSVSYIAEHSSKAQPLGYKISALWGGQGGSLLLWAWVLCLFSFLVARSGKRDKNELAPTACAIINSVAIFFLLLISTLENPFATSGTAPPDGRGLNPLLQNYWMQIHPPTLYVGYVGCVVPFAWAMSALLHRRYDATWLATVRRWTLFPWIILTCGIIMGGRWAYETLGWGGYWAWDPVENASFLPWLTATAFLHSIMIQGRRGMLKSWNMVLVVLTFVLSIFGTFLTRSGVVSSVHSFAESNIGPWFLGYIFFAMVASFSVVVWRRADLVPDAEMESALSREGAFLLNNWVLLASAIAILWGTVYPSVAEAVFGTTVTVGKPYFNSVMIPLGLILLALAGVGPLMAWRKMSPQKLFQMLRLPLLLGVLALPGFYLLSRWHTGAAAAVCLCVFVATAIISEFVRGAKARRNMTGENYGESLFNMVIRNRQRYGGYIVHLGIVIIFTGFAGAAFDTVTEPITLQQGGTMKIGEYTLQFKQLVQPRDLSKEKEREVLAEISVQSHGKEVNVLRPGIAFFKTVGNADRQPSEAQTGAIPAIASNPAHDLYLVLAEYDTVKNTVAIKAWLNPLVMWIWVSPFFFIGGTIISLLPDPRPMRARAAARERSVPSARTGAQTAPRTATQNAVAASTDRRP